jgi:hypothetical protein
MQIARRPRFKSVCNDLRACHPLFFGERIKGAVGRVEESLYVSINSLGDFADQMERQRR